MRRARDNSLGNLENLITNLIHRLSTLRHLPAFPDLDLAPQKHALNCIRVLTRILPFLYEADHLEVWEDKFFWQARKKLSSKGRAKKTEILFDESQADEITKPEPKELYEDARPLGEEMVDVLIDLLFCTGFSLPHNSQLRNKITYAIWQKGVGCNTQLGSSKEIESNRTEILRLLLTLSSKSLYMPASTFCNNLQCLLVLTERRYSSH